MTTPTPVAPPDNRRKLPFALQAGEGVLLFTRRHWVFAAWELTKLALIAILPIVALLLLAKFTFGFDGRKGLIVAALSLIWALIWLVRGYFAWYRFSHDIWIVTNQRIIDSVKRHWFHHRMASADLDDVEDIALVKEGLFPTMFDYGDLRLQTAGELGNFVLAGIPDPKDVLALVDKERDAAKRRLRGIAT